MSHDHNTPQDASAKDAVAQCTDFLQGIVYLLDNELDAADVSEVRTHLDSCNPCFETYDLQRRVKELVARSCAETAPADLRLKITMLCREVSAEQFTRPAD
jgi:mycothiol system anti-sigma-R factor